VAELFTVPNIALVLTLVFHFGLLRAELKQLRGDVGDLKVWRDKRIVEEDATYARRDVLGEHISSIDRRLGAIEESVKNHYGNCPVVKRVERLERGRE